VDPLALARGELLEETGLVADEMIHAGHLFKCYGHSTQGYDVYLAQGLMQHEHKREQSEQDMICRRFALADVEAMIKNGTIKDAASVAGLGLLRLHGLI
jgi:ADP-ribose pyrophosphatase